MANYSVLLFYPEFEYAKSVAIVSWILLIVISLQKIFSTPFVKWLIHLIPESLIYVFIGFIIGFVKWCYPKFANQISIYSMMSSSFMIYVLLPPIILDASYKIYSKDLVLQITPILSYAIIGTAFNILTIGTTFHILYGRNQDHSYLDGFILGSMLAAVDPVAVLAIFSDMGIRKSLYVLIFGESLLNDGITLSAFNTVKKMTMIDNPSLEAIPVGLLATFIVIIGGIFVGTIFGVLSAIVTKFCFTKIDNIHGILVLALAYQSFLIAQVFGWSGIISLIVCGLYQRHYTFFNLGYSARQFVATLTDAVAGLSEIIFFVMIGEQFYGITWTNSDIKPVAICIISCLIYRFVAVFLIGYLLNYYKLASIPSKCLFAMSYGGLRGGIAFAMLRILESENNWRIIKICTLSVIMFTISVQGGTVRYIMKFLGLKDASKDDTVTSAVIDRITQHATAAMEGIHGGGNLKTCHLMIEHLNIIDDKWIRPFLCRKTSVESLWGLKKLVRERRMNEALLLNYRCDQCDQNSKASSSNPKNLLLAPGTIDIKDNLKVPVKSIKTHTGVCDSNWKNFFLSHRQFSDKDEQRYSSESSV